MRLSLNYALAAAVAAIAAGDQSLAEDSMELKVRIQPRLDFGEYAAAGGASYESRLDLYIRRSRIELRGRPADGVSYYLAAAGDRVGRRGSSAGAVMEYAYVNYRINDAINLRAGKAKLPFVRGARTTDTRILLIERAKAATTAAAGIGRYTTPHLSLHGRLANGTIGYGLALTDGFQAGDSDGLSKTAVAVSDNPGFVARVEFSPDGWVEGRGDESHLGVGRHLTVGLNGARQSGIELGTARAEDRLVYGGDVSFHRGGLSFQSEYLRVERDGPVDSAPGGWYVQLGYYLTGIDLEPAGRFERYDADAGGRVATTIYTGGLNYYRHGHELKFMANVVHTRFGRGVREVTGAGSRTQLQLQSQMYF